MSGLSQGSQGLTVNTNPVRVCIASSAWSTPRRHCWLQDPNPFLAEASVVLALTQRVPA